MAIRRPGAPQGDSRSRSLDRVVNWRRSGTCRPEGGKAVSRLLDFYRGEGTDAEGRRLDDILAWRDGRLEAVHDFIQWLFPLPEPSRFNPDAPLLTPHDIAAFH